MKFWSSEIYFAPDVRRAPLRRDLRFASTSSANPIYSKEEKMKGRNLQTLVFSMLFIFALFSLTQGKALISKNEKSLSIQNQLALSDFEHYQKFSRLTNSYFVYDNDSTKEKVATDVYGFKGKSIKRAFVYSLILPGAGEFYAGSKIKAGIFFGLDVALWSLYFNYHGKGKDKEKDYIVFADSSWDEEEYRIWWETLPDTTRTRYSHSLPDEHDQQYYEMIGKYKQFAFAWRDFDKNTAGQDSMTPKRDHYLGMRAQSNRLLNKAKYSVMFSLANHVLSSFDAAVAVKKYNKKGERFSQLEFKLRLTERDDQIVPKLSMSMRF
jgi:hypothetical protein